MSRVRPAPVTTSDPVGQSALVAILERISVGAVAMTTRALAEADTGAAELTFPQWRVMMILGDRPDGARVGEVATRVGVTLPATSRLLRRLSGRGLVALATDELDHRATRARLTPEGERVRHAILAHRRRRLEEIASRIGDGHHEALLRDLDDLAAQFDAFA